MENIENMKMVTPYTLQKKLKVKILVLTKPWNYIAVLRTEI